MIREFDRIPCFYNFLITNFKIFLSVISPKFNAEFFKQFAVVMNALDNLAARTHVNRMCLAANVPLVESGTGHILNKIHIFVHQYIFTATSIFIHILS